MSVLSGVAEEHAPGALASRRSTAEQAAGAAPRFRCGHLGLRLPVKAVGRAAAAVDDGYAARRSASSLLAAHAVADRRSGATRSSTAVFRLRSRGRACFVPPSRARRGPTRTTRCGRPTSSCSSRASLYHRARADSTQRCAAPQPLASALSARPLECSTNNGTVSDDAAARTRPSARCCTKTVRLASRDVRVLIRVATSAALAMVSSQGLPGAARCGHGMEVHLGGGGGGAHDGAFLAYEDGHGALHKLGIGRAAGDRRPAGVHRLRRRLRRRHSEATGAAFVRAGVRPRDLHRVGRRGRRPDGAPVCAGVPTTRCEATRAR